MTVDRIRLANRNIFSPWKRATFVDKFSIYYAARVGVQMAHLLDGHNMVSVAVENAYYVIAKCRLIIVLDIIEANEINFSRLLEN